jgi:indolepyruvate ferredoxin oxidoreductase, beta subunit
VDALPHVAKLDINTLAKENNTPKSANMILLGMAAPFIEIVSADDLRDAIRAVFAKRGNEVVEVNIKAFDLGYNSTKQ